MPDIQSKITRHNQTQENTIHEEEKKIKPDPEPTQILEWKGLT